LGISVLVQVFLDLSGPVFEALVHVYEVKGGEIVLLVIPECVTVRANSGVVLNIPESTSFSVLRSSEAEDAHGGAFRLAVVQALSVGTDFHPLGGVLAIAARALLSHISNCGCD